MRTFLRILEHESMILIDSMLGNNQTTDEHRSSMIEPISYQVYDNYNCVLIRRHFTYSRFLTKKNKLKNFLITLNSLGLKFN